MPKNGDLLNGNHRLQGVPATLLSQGCKEDAATISCRVRIADEGGLVAPCPKKRAGCQSRLGSKERASLKTVLEEDNPPKYGYYVWDGRSLSDYIQKSFSVPLGIRQCQRLLIGASADISQQGRGQQGRA